MYLSEVPQMKNYLFPIYVLIFYSISTAAFSSETELTKLVNKATNEIQSIERTSADMMSQIQSALSESEEATNLEEIVIHGQLLTIDGLVRLFLREINEVVMQPLVARKELGLIHHEFTKVQSRLTLKLESTFRYMDSTSLTEKIKYDGKFFLRLVDYLSSTLKDIQGVSAGNGYLCKALILIGTRCSPRGGACGPVYAPEKFEAIASTKAEARLLALAKCNTSNASSGHSCEVRLNRCKILE